MGVLLQNNWQRNYHYLEWKIEASETIWTQKPLKELYCNELTIPVFYSFSYKLDFVWFCVMEIYLWKWQNAQKHQMSEIAKCPNYSKVDNLELETTTTDKIFEKNSSFHVKECTMGKVQFEFFEGVFC